MTRTAAILLLLGAAALVYGIAMVNVPAGFIAGGILAIAGGVLMLERRPQQHEARR